jgi:hypothetical protein
VDRGGYECASQSPAKMDDSFHDRVLFLDEYKVHGCADPVESWRGVIFVAGILDRSRRQVLDNRAVEWRRV